MLDRPQVDAVRKLAHELVEQVDGLAAIRLQRLDDLLARDHGLDLLAQPVDFLDLLVQLGDFRLEQRIAAHLVFDLRAEDAVDQQDDGERQRRQHDGKRDELPLARLTPLLAVRQ